MEPVTSPVLVVSAAYADEDDYGKKIEINNYKRALINHFLGT